ncbi:NAD-dependent epimerase/dehydratase family protein [Phreatobacter stygius]|uniref:NAD-dependent epimerase/dehydratase family protein n=1 Tax=Phreatobacter stygius TaxID=1940610 RepID=UPI0014777180|nr:NAD-dependent epimerase/dehydratase family protein [Phreatobacter stygius]
MRVLVTGASGFVGAAIAEFLASQGHQLRAGARDPRMISARPGITPWALPDLDNPVDWRPHLEGLDAVVHAAGLAHQLPGTGEDRMMRINAQAAGDLARAATAAGIRHVVLISSIRAIAGPAADTALVETDEPRPTDAYGRSKLAGERLTREAFPAAVVLRPAVVHGAGAKANMARLAWLARLALPLPVGGLAGRRSLVSDRNLASAVGFALAAPKAPGQLFHVTDGAPLTLPAMLAAMRKALGRAPGILSLPFQLERRLIRLGAPGLYDQLGRDLVASNAALLTAGWAPVEPTAEGLGRTALAIRPQGQTRL